MRALVTGAAGFIGSHLAERLCERGHHVRAVDSFSPYYDVAQKRANVRALAELAACELVEDDLTTADLGTFLRDVDVVFHQAGQPGVRASWRDSFVSYVQDNVVATQRLLEAAKDGRVGRFVFASSSSVYGEAPEYPAREETPTRPHSPYGVTKLAAEQLCDVYARNWGVPVVSLRYFTVYGPRQRPDMAIHRLLESAIGGGTFSMYGDGTQKREFTYVEDVVRANLLAATADVRPGTVVNVGGGEAVALADLLGMVGDLVGRSPSIDRLPTQPGDVARTGASIDLARRLLGWRPEVSLRDGLAEQLAWHRERGVRAPIGPDDGSALTRSAAI
jgi:UDP-glucuronate 4-epimerase